MRPNISFDEVEADFREVFEGGMFTRGHHCEAFRHDIVRYTGASHAHLVTSATTALWVCLKLLKIKAGDEVIVSDFSFPATANVVEDLGARPVFADVSLSTFNMTPSALEAAVTPATRAVIFVDALGNPTGVTAIRDLCRRLGLPLIEDAACAIGSAEAGARCGTISDATCFSFHPRKLLCTGEGGAITTNRADWADWLDVKLAHGARGMKGVALDFVNYGYNFRLPELQSVMGRKQLAKLDNIIDERNRIRDRYIDVMAPLGFVAQSVGSDVRYNVQSMVFKVPTGCSRDGLIGKAQEPWYRDHNWHLRNEQLHILRREIRRAAAKLDLAGSEHDYTALLSGAGCFGGR
ncbi:aminotransferase class I/II-fold pyridoxal phosphate-dependent enzyme [Devosia algicola]|uniref:Aminotransferase class I/II-fold pyridoxal phosphate-dependent enzyme n=1 Tax=Devosia algicola TaxID=3026418 RepID=A0ABY7YU24_9HYPH|nr:aminotransferase class I/II-fold pyridoxal phosphate-dependent enzyme [Devosia algicola]WDR04350.1 aminotransferase class I/II-fold pyridoxal phosphate-dependent enzyme [Devosia algicola]